MINKTGTKCPCFGQNSLNYGLGTVKYRNSWTPQAIIMLCRTISQVGKSKYYDMKGKQGEMHGGHKGNIGGQSQGVPPEKGINAGETGGTGRYVAPLPCHA
jgi:hypothetical protein